MKKSLFLLFGLLILSCTESYISNPILTKDDLCGTWRDIDELKDGFTGIDPTFKGAEFTLNSDNTYTVSDSNSLLDVFIDGEWQFIPDSLTVFFNENTNDTINILNSEKYEITKYWKITDYIDSVLYVDYILYRKEDYVYQPITNEIDTISGIDITIRRIFKKVN